MATRKKRRKAGRRAKKQGTPGWVWAVVGLSIGLVIAFAIYVNDRKPGGTAAPAETAAPAKVEVKTAPPEEPKKSSKYSFYELLPNEDSMDTSASTNARKPPAKKTKPVSVPGVYVVQAGSFSSHGDADSMKAQLALLGISSSIQKVQIGEKTWHRVRTGPLDQTATNHAEMLLQKENINYDLYRAEN